MSCPQKERILIRALKKARCIRTLSFILSLTGRGNRGILSLARRGGTCRSRLNQTVKLPSASAFLSPLPVRERMKVRVRIQRAFLAPGSRFCPSLFCFRSFKKRIDCAQYLLNTLQNLGVPESKNPVALRLEKRRADFVFPGSFDVLCPIEFDDEPSFRRAKISEVRTDRMLTAKFGATHLPGSQMVPQDSFRIGLLATQAASVFLGRLNRAHRFRMFASHREKTSAKRNRILIRALNKARCKRTLSFILSLTGRGDRK